MSDPGSKRRKVALCGGNVMAVDALSEFERTERNSPAPDVDGGKTVSGTKRGSDGTVSLIIL